MVSSKQSEINKLISYILINQPVHYPDLMNLLEISRKKLAGYLKEIDNLLSDKNVYLVRKRNKGISFEGDKEELNQFLNKSINYLGPEDEKNSILLLLLLVNKEIMIDEICERYFLSRSTVDRIIKELKNKIQSYNLKIDNNQNGIFIVGDESTKRNLASRLILENYQESINNQQREIRIPSEFENIFQISMIDQVQKILSSFIEITKLDFEEYQYQSLLIHICILIKRIEVDEFLKNKKEDYSFYPETIILKKLLEEHFNVKIPNEEVEYLNIHIMALKEDGIRSPQLNQETIENKELRELKGLLINNLFEYDSRLINDLVIHLTSAIHRFKLNLQIVNPYKEQIIKKYYWAFNQAYELGKKLNEYYNIEISKDEVAYIAIHFQSYFERKGKSNKINIVIVCSTGVGTGRLLTQRIETFFSERIIVKRVISVKELFSEPVTEDLIVSTVAIDYPGKKVILMSPIGDEESLGLLTMEVGNLQSRQNQGKLLSFLSPQAIFIDNSSQTRKEALKRIGEELIKLGVGKKEITQAIWEREQIGSTALAKYHVAIPHADPKYIKKSLISISIFPNGINWDGSLVYIAFLLGYSENDIKLLPFNTIYQEFNKLISNKELIDKIKNSDSSKKVLDLIKQGL